MISSCFSFNYQQYHRRLVQFNFFLTWVNQRYVLPLYKNKKVKAVRKKLRKVSTKANKSNRFKKAIQRQQAKEEIKVRSLLQEVLTRFTSTFLMIGSYLQAPKSGDIDEEIVRYFCVAQPTK